MLCNSEIDISTEIEKHIPDMHNEDSDCEAVPDVVHWVTEVENCQAMYMCIRLIGVVLPEGYDGGRDYDAVECW